MTTTHLSIDPRRLALALYSWCGGAERKGPAVHNEEAIPEDLLTVPTERLSLDAADKIKLSELINSQDYANDDARLGMWWYDRTPQYLGGHLQHVQEVLEAQPGAAAC